MDEYESEPECWVSFPNIFFDEEIWRIVVKDIVYATKDLLEMFRFN
jgi:hypothetical protein